jgi:hypothetical protein
MTDFPTLQVPVYAFTIWFGFYLLARHPQKAVMRYAGLGLVAYAFGLEVDTLAGLMDDNEGLLRWRPLIALLPALCWLGAMKSIREYDNQQNLPRRPLLVFLIGSIFFFLGIGMLVLPFEFISSDLAVIGIGGDLVMLSYAIAVLDAYDEGESFLPDALRSLGASAVVTLIFGGQVALVMVINDEVTLEMVILLLGTISAAIFLQTFSDTIQILFDRLLLSRLPALQVERAELRGAAAALPRVDDSLDMAAMDDAEFARLTRRALSHMGNLSRLASNPLTRMVVVESRLAERGQNGNTLERAAELKVLLTESINRLKPRDKGDYGVSDEWRYFNAVYFPYVLGIKPYSRRMMFDEFEANTKDVIEWFRVQVPERTLHNWQNAASRLIAQDLREMDV